MEINVTFHQGRDPVAIMRPQGELNGSSFIEFSDKAHELYSNPARNLILDLSEVPNISSAGLVAIHRIALLYSGIPQNVVENFNLDFTHSDNARKHVMLLNPQPEVDKILQRAGLKLFFNVFQNLDSAIASF